MSRTRRVDFFRRVDRQGATATACDRVRQDATRLGSVYVPGKSTTVGDGGTFLGVFALNPVAI